MFMETALLSLDVTHVQQQQLVNVIAVPEDTTRMLQTLVAYVLSINMLQLALQEAVSIVVSPNVHLLVHPLV